MEYKFTVQAKIQKPVAEVFDGVYNPDKLSAYFTTAGSSGPLDPGTTVMWDFADVVGDAFPVHVKEVVPNELISFEWAADDAGSYNTRVELKFQELEDGSTLVSIHEGVWEETKDGLKTSYGNCQGWMNMAACLKAYLEYGINLRQGFF